MTAAPPRNVGVTSTPRAPSLCPICQRAFQRVGRQQVCSAACRQALWRQRHPRPLPVLPARSPRTTTVYACATCETRYVGEQWCTDCQRPCRRVGPGGACPHCDEPVALSDLLPERETGRG